MMRNRRTAVRRKSDTRIEPASAGHNSVQTDAAGRAVAQQRPLFRREVLEFQQYNRQWGRVVPLQPLSTRLMVWCVVVASACVIAFLFVGQYARKEVAVGYLKPASGSARVFAPEQGIISTVYVRQGQRVIEGEPLIAVTTSQIAGNGDDVNAAVLHTLEQQKSSLAARIENEVHLNASEQDRLTAQAKELDSELTTYTAQLAIQRTRISLLEGMVAMGAELRAKGLMSEIDQKHREDSLLEQRQAFITTSQQMMAQRSKLTQINFDIAQLPSALTAKVQPLRNDLLSTEQRIAETNGRRAYIVRAPIGGLVSLLQASVGQQADPRRMQLQIVPTDSPLQAELFIPASAIGFVEAGQDVRILYDAFPYQRFGTYRGRIVEVSQTVLMDGDLVAPVKVNQPVYTATVALDRPNVDVRGRKVPLQPDMSLRADIILERRSIMDWIVGPLRHIGLQ